MPGICEDLLAAGGDPDAANIKGEPPLLLAIRRFETTHGGTNDQFRETVAILHRASAAELAKSAPDGKDVARRRGP